MVWSFTARRPSRVPKLRRFFAEREFEELSFVTLPGDDLALTVALSRYCGTRQKFAADTTFFTFGSSHRPRDDAAGGQDEAPS